MDYWKYSGTYVRWQRERLENGDLRITGVHGETKEVFEYVIPRGDKPCSKCLGLTVPHLPFSYRLEDRYWLKQGEELPRHQCGRCGGSGVDPKPRPKVSMLSGPQGVHDPIPLSSIYPCRWMEGKRNL